MQPRLKHFGWGREGEGLTAGEKAFVLGRIEQRFGPPAEQQAKPPRLEDIKLAPPRLEPPASLSFCSTARYDRAAHTYGKSFPDYVRGLAGNYSSAPDVVAYPRTEDEIAAVLDWAGGAQASVTPFGGGSSVVGGVEPQRDPARHKAAVTIDLRELGRGHADVLGFRLRQWGEGQRRGGNEGGEGGPQGQGTRQGERLHVISSACCGFREHV